MGDCVACNGTLKRIQDCFMRLGTPIIIPNAHIPVDFELNVIMVYIDMRRTSKSHRKLEKGYSSATTTTKTMVHYGNVRVSAAHFGVDHNQSNGPICHRTKNNKEEYASKESRLANSIRET